MLPFFIQEAWATEYNLKDPASCKEMAGTWNSNFLTCAINGLILFSGDKLIVGSGMHLENIGIITNNGGKIYNYGSILTDEFSVIYNNVGGAIYNNGTITTSGSTINNYASIYNNHGSIDNYGTVYNYDIIYNYNGSTIDDRYGVTYNKNGTINNDCGSVLIGLVPYGNQVRNVCSTMQSSTSIPPIPLPQSGTNPQAPLEQLKSGIRAKDVICRQGFQLIIKIEDGSPACVKPETAQKLVEYRWGTQP
ncbi:MAG: hypothetical protein ACREBB_05235 [Nitrosotalea sp.]